MDTLVKNPATGTVAGLLKAQYHSQKTVELADYLTMTNQKLQAGSVLMDVLGLQGGCQSGQQVVSLPWSVHRGWLRYIGGM